MQTFAIPVGLGAPHAISLGEDTCTSANDPASILSTSILVELADPDGPGLPWRRTSPLHRRRQQAKRSEPASSFALAVPNTTASCISSSTNFEAPAANLAINMDLPGNHIILDMAQTPLEFGVVPLLPPARRNWSGVAPFSISPNADTHMATIRLGKHETVSEVAGLGVYGALP